MRRVSELSLGVHTGTHFDAPNHFDVKGGGVEGLPLDSLVGVARVVAVQGAEVRRDDSEPHQLLERGERVLLKTSNSARCWNTDEFVPDYVYVTADAARHLVERRIRTVGVDYLSLGGPDDGIRAHQVLLEAGVCILEGLDLRRVDPGFVDPSSLCRCSFPDATARPRACWCAHTEPCLPTGIAIAKTRLHAERSQHAECADPAARAKAGGPVLRAGGASDGAARAVDVPEGERLRHGGGAPLHVLGD